MKRWVLIGLFCLAGSGMAEASVLDWPVIGQLARVGVCLIGETGHLAGSLLSHLGTWGAELVGTIGKCSQVVVNQATDVATHVVTLTIPTPQPEAPHAETPQ